MIINKQIVLNSKLEWVAHKKQYKNDKIKHKLKTRLEEITARSKAISSNM